MHLLHFLSFAVLSQAVTSSRSSCILSEGEWMCDPLPLRDLVSRASCPDQLFTTSGEPLIVSEVSSKGCIQHEAHFHCPETLADSCDAVDLGNYDLRMHIIALFVVLVGSFLGVALPVLPSANTPRPAVQNALFVLKHFGTGVIISTAFVHLLVHAFTMFGNPCLGELDYAPTAPAIIMAATMAVFLIDFFAARWMAARKVLAKECQDPSDLSSIEMHPETQHPAPAGLATLGHDHGGGGIFIYDGASRQAHWDVQLLEAGIIFHSVMIGVTLGAQAGPGFIPTFCAIVFHQLFEGLGLGARVATLVWPQGQGWKKWAMCTGYALITPVGIAIGMGVHETFNLNGKASLLTIGILDSISSGILLYGGLCQLLMMEWVHGEMRDASNKRMATGLASMFLGIIAMSIIGQWA